MSKEKKITVDEYRQKHKRCRTCAYSEYKYSKKFYCKAKNVYIKGDFYGLNLKGSSCILYSAKEFKV